MSKYRKYTFRGLLAGAFIALFAMVGGFVFNSKPLVAQSPRDCDSNAIIYCGAMTVDELTQKYNQNTTGDLTTLYNYFGITAQGVASLKTQTALGQVHSDGTIWLNGQKIADNVLTAGRHYKAGSTQVPGTSVWARSPRVSFASSSIDAFIGFENGKPAWAILSACGNPVKWDRPNVSVDKKVAKQDLTSWVEDATYTNNSEVSYLVTVKNTGNASDTNVTVMDRLPSYQTYIAGSTKVNNAANVDGIATTGINLGTLTAGQTVYITFRTKLSVPTGKCGVTNMINTVRQDSDKAGPHEDTATTNTNVVCIVVSCNALTGPDAITLGESATYKVDATAIGTTISGYIFTVDGQAQPITTSSTFVFTPTTTGTHNVSAVVKFANGLTATGNGKCAKPLTVKDKPAPKIVTCTSLDGPATFNVGESVTFTTKTSDDTLVGAYAYYIDGTLVQRGAAVATNTLVVNLPAGNHTIKAVITPKAGVTDGGSANCVRNVTVKDIPQPPVYSCDLLTVAPAAIQLGGKVTAVASYTAKNGAVFKNAVFNFGEGAPVTVTDANNVSAMYNYTTIGDKTVTVEITFTIPGGTVSTTPGNCSKHVTVTDQPIVLTSCDALNATKLAFKLGDTTTLSAQASALNTTITEYIFSVNGQVVQNGSTKNTYDFKPTAAGDYNVTVTVKFANGDTKGGDAACAKKVTVTVDTPPCEYNPSLPKDSPDCKPPVEMCLIPGKTQYPKNDARCNDVKGVTTIPDTGAGSMMGVFAGVTAAGAFLHSALARRAASRR